MQQPNIMNTYPEEKRVTFFVDMFAVQIMKAPIQAFETVKQAKIRVEKRQVVWSSRKQSGWGSRGGLEPAPKFTLFQRMLLHHFSHPVAEVWLPIWSEKGARS